MKKQQLLSLAVALALAGGVAEAAPVSSGLEYAIVLGYGTSNFTLINPTNSPVTVNSISFNYAGPLQPFLSGTKWGFFNSTNITLSETPIQGNLNHYVLTFITPQTIPAQYSEPPLGQIPLGNASSDPTAPTAATPDYQGVFSSVMVNGEPVPIQGACVGLACNDPAPNYLLGGYFADWSIYGAHGNYQISDLVEPNGDFPYNTLFDDVATIYPAQGSVGVTDPNSDIGKGQIATIALLRTQYPYLNGILSVGGWGSVSSKSFPSGDLSVLFTYYPAQIPVLAQNLVNTMLQYGFNGIDVDYEWIGPFEYRSSVLQSGQPWLATCNGVTNYCQSTPLSQAEADGYATLLQDIRQDQNQLQAAHPDLNSNGYKLTAAILANPSDMALLAGFKNESTGQPDLEIIANSVTSLDLMNYDAHGAFDAPATGQAPGIYNVSGFQSGFMADPSDPNVKNGNSPADQFNMVDTVQDLEAYLKIYGVSSTKIVVGVPAYARIEKLNVQGLPGTGLYQPLASIDQQMQAGTLQAGEFSGDYYFAKLVPPAPPKKTHPTIQGLNSNPNVYGVNGSGTFDYKCIMSTIAANPPTGGSNVGQYCYYSQNSGSKPYPSTMQFYNMNSFADNPYAETPWGYDAASGTFMSFDNYNSARNKAQYVVQQHLGGVMEWEVDGDLPTTDPNFLTESIVAGMQAGLASST